MRPLVIAILVALLLSACSRSRSFRVVGPSGEQLLQVSVVAFRPGQPESEARVGSGGNGRFRVPGDAIHPNSRFAVIAPGCRIAEGAMADAPSEIHLEKGIPVRLVLAEGYAFPDPSLTLVARCEPVDYPAGLPPDCEYNLSHAVLPQGAMGMDPMDRMGLSCFFDPGPKAADVLFPCAGKWQVNLSIMRYEVENKGSVRTTTGLGHGLGDDEVPPVLVRDTGTMETIVLRPDPKAWERALREMKSGR